MKQAQELLTEAIAREGEAQQALFRGDAPSARAAFRAASVLYRRSWQAAPPTSYGRLVGLLKAGILGGEGSSQAEYVRSQLGTRGADSATAAYAQALAALILGDARAAARWSKQMQTGGEAFTRTAAAIEALADDDAERYAGALMEIVADFEARQNHLTGVAIADTALMLEQLAAARGIAAGVESSVLPAWP